MTCLSIYLFIRPSIFVFLHPLICLFVYLYIYLCVHLLRFFLFFLFVVCLRFYSLFFVLVSLFISVFCGFCLNYLLLPYCFMYFSLVLSKLRWRKRNNKPSKQNLRIHVHRKTVYININLNHSLGEITNSIIINRKIH
jgi:hypothetical protein